MDIEKIVQETFKNYHMSSVLILMKTQVGNRCLSASSGFVIGKGESFYLVMTCNHNIELVGQNVILGVRLSGKTIEYKAEKLYSNKIADIAIIKVEGVPESEDCPILTFDDSENIPPKADIIQLGHINDTSGLSLYPSVSLGIFVALLHEPEGLKKVIYAAAGKTGISGSPILLNFKVIGVVYGASLTDQMMYAVSTNSIQNVMKSWLKLSPEDGSTIEQMINTILQNV